MPAGRRRGTRRRTKAAVNADNSIGQHTGSCKLSANLTDVLLSTPDLRGDADLAEVRPSAVGELDGTALVGTAQTLTVSAVGAEGEPERGLTSAVIHVGGDLGTPSLPIGGDAVVTVGEQVHAVGPENDDRRELSAVDQHLHVLVDDRVVDVRADLSARIGDERVKREDLAERRADRGIRRQPRRGTRSRNSRRRGSRGDGPEVGTTEDMARNRLRAGCRPAAGRRERRGGSNGQGEGIRSHARRPRPGARAVDQVVATGRRGTANAGSAPTGCTASATTAVPAGPRRQTAAGGTTPPTREPGTERKAPAGGRGRRRWRSEPRWMKRDSRREAEADCRSTPRTQRRAACSRPRPCCGSTRNEQDDVHPTRAHPTHASLREVLPATLLGMALSALVDLDESTSSEHKAGLKERVRRVARAPREIRAQQLAALIAVHPQDSWPGERKNRGRRKPEYGEEGATALSIFSRPTDRIWESALADVPPNDPWSGKSLKGARMRTAPGSASSRRAASAAPTGVMAAVGGELPRNYPRNPNIFSSSFCVSSFLVLAVGGWSASTCDSSFSRVTLRLLFLVAGCSAGERATFSPLGLHAALARPLPLFSARVNAMFPGVNATSGALDGTFSSFGTLRPASSPSFWPSWPFDPRVNAMFPGVNATLAPLDGFFSSPWRFTRRVLPLSGRLGRFARALTQCSWALTQLLAGSGSLSALLSRSGGSA